MGPQAKVARRRSSAYDNNFAGLLHESGVNMPAAHTQANNVIPSNLDMIGNILVQADFISNYKQPSPDD